MTHIILEGCIKCKYTDCVNVCPVDCFHEGKNFLVINTEICIDCAICIPECPVEAISLYEDIKENKELLFQINFELSKIWPSIVKKNKTIFNDKWKFIKNKLHLIKI